MKKKPISFGSIGFELVASMEEAKANLAPEEPFRICVLGDFSGRMSRGIKESLKARKPILVDRDNFDDVILKIEPKVVFHFLEQKIEASFESLDGFHPDELFGRIALFQALKDTRRKLKDPRTYNAALKELRALTGAGKEETGAKEKAPAKPAASGDSLLDRILSENGEGAFATTDGPGRGELADFVAAIVKPYRVAPPDPAEDRLIAALDSYISVLMAEFLHHESMQGIESAWRGLRFLVFRAETDENLQIRLLDISKEELLDDLLSADDLSETNLYKLFVKEPLASPNGKPWALLVGNYAFDHEDAGALGRMAKIASAAGAPFIAGAGPHLIGCSSLAATPDPAEWRYKPTPEELTGWEELRRLSEATYLGLAAPRFLLRLPYGSDTDPVEVFEFEETVEGLEHEHYLWGNPAFACACLLAESFSREGWGLTPGSVHDIDGLPLHTFDRDGESALKPCAEINLTDKAVEAILDRGIMPLATLKGTDAARLVRFQSLSSVPQGLSGRWDRS